MKTNNQSGFTLIEVLIAALIITFGMLAMGAFLNSYMFTNTNNDRRTNATIWAEQKIEELRTVALAGDLTSADSDSTGRSLDASGTDIGASGTAGEVYRLIWRVDDSSNPHTITTQVFWLDGTVGAAPDVTLTTLVNDDA